MKQSDNEMKERAPVAEEQDFKGYTLNELRYQRAILLVKREFLKEKAFKEAHRIKQRLPFVGGESAFSHITPKGVVGKLISGLNVFDYLMLGFQALRIGKKVTGLFKKK